MKHSLRTFLTASALTLAATVTGLAAAAPSTAANPITVQQAPVSPVTPLALYVDKIEIKKEKVGGVEMALGEVKIKEGTKDEKGKIKGAKDAANVGVTVTFQPPVGPAMTATTDSKGVATFTVAYTKGVTYTLTVTNVARAGSTYDPADNKETTETKKL